MKNSVDLNDEIKPGMSVDTLCHNVECRIKNLSYYEIQKYIENMQPQHREHLERYVREQNHKMIGQAIMLSIHQHIQAEEME